MESTNGFGAGQNVPVNYAEIPSASQHGVQNTAVIGQNGQQQGRLFTQAEVNEIAFQSRREGMERAPRMQTEQPNYYQQKYVDNNRPMYAEQDIDKIVADKLNAALSQKQAEYAEQQRIAQERAFYERGQKLANQFKEKKQTGTQKFADYEQEVTDQKMLGNYPLTVTTIMENVDNIEEVLYEISKDPFKAALIEQAAMNPNSTAGLDMVKKLSNDLKKREEQEEEKRLQPTVNNFVKKLSSSAGISGANSSKNMPTAADYAKMYKR